MSNARTTEPAHLPRVDDDTPEAKPFRLRITVVNCKRGGFNRETRRHDLGLLKEMLSELKKPPHVVFLSECTRYLEYEREAFFGVQRLLGTMWGVDHDDDGRPIPSVPYQGAIATVPGSINVPGVYIDTRYVEPYGWYDLDSSRHVYANCWKVRINGQPFLLKPVHWNGSLGAYYFYQQAARDGQLGGHNAIAAGDFNCTSSEPDEVLPQWGQHCATAGKPWKLSQKAAWTPGGWELNTTAYDQFLQHGWVDAGTDAGVFTPTTNTDEPGLRTDHIAITEVSPAEFVPGTYVVHKTAIGPDGERRSDHEGVSVEVLIRPPAHQVIQPASTSRPRPSRLPVS